MPSVSKNVFFCLPEISEEVKHCQGFSNPWGMEGDQRGENEFTRQWDLNKVPIDLTYDRPFSDMPCHVVICHSNHIYIA